MNSRTMTVLVNSMSDLAEVESLYQVVQRKAFWLSEDALYRHESPAYAYWAKGGGGNFGYMTPEQRAEWDAERERLTARVRKYRPCAKMNSTLPPKQESRTSLMWRALLIGVSIGSVIGGISVVLLHGNL